MYKYCKQEKLLERKSNTLYDRKNEQYTLGGEREQER